MECRVCSDSLTAFIDDELNPAERAAVQSHLSRCSHCRDEHESLRYCVALTDALELSEINAPSFAAVASRLSPETGKFWDFGWLFSPAWATMAAALLLAVSIPFFWDANDPEAHLERQFAQFVEERDRMEALHHGIIAAEPVGWVTYNPFSVDRGNRETGPANPFSE